jgi:hypothetical protein
MFRKLNEAETKLLSKLRKRGGETPRVKGLLNQKRVRYDEFGNFTVCVLKVGPSIYTGVAKANPTDAYNPEVGQAIAFSRAVTGH